MRPYRGQTLPDGRLLLHQRPEWAWLTEDAAVNLVGFYWSEQAALLRPSVVFTALGDACVCPGNLDAAMQLVQDSQQARGSAPTVLAAADGSRVQGSGVLDASADGVFSGLGHLHAHIGTTNLGERRAQVLQRLKDARSDCDARASPQAVARRQAAQRGLEEHKSALQTASNLAAELRLSYQEACRGGAPAGPPPATTSPPRTAESSAAAKSAVATVPTLEGAGLDGTVVYASRPDSDGLFGAAELLLQQGGQALEGAYVLRFSLHSAINGPLLRVRPDVPGPSWRALGEAFAGVGGISNCGQV